MILRLRHVLERHRLTAQLFDTVKAPLKEQRLLLKAGTLVDARYWEWTDAQPTAGGTVYRKFPSPMQFTSAYSEFKRQ